MAKRDTDRLANQRPGRGGRRPGAGRKPAPGESLEAARRRKESALADLRVMEVRRRRGELVELDAVCEAVARRTSACRARLLALAPKVAPLVAVLDDPDAVRQVVADAVEEALGELAADAAALADGGA